MCMKMIVPFPYGVDDEVFARLAWTKWTGYEAAELVGALGAMTIGLCVALWIFWGNEACIVASVVCYVIVLGIMWRDTLVRFREGVERDVRDQWPFKMPVPCEWELTETDLVVRKLGVEREYKWSNLRRCWQGSGYFVVGFLRSELEVLPCVDEVPGDQRQKVMECVRRKLAGSAPMSS